MGGIVRRIIDYLPYVAWAAAVYALSWGDRQAAIVFMLTAIFLKMK